MFPDSPASPVAAREPPRDCPLCPRLVGYRETLRRDHPDWWNAPVHVFGAPRAWLAVVGLAPGKQGANRTGRPFTGDASGQLLFDTLLGQRLASGSYRPEGDDDLSLHGVVIVNAVRCAPPQNKPLPAEIAACRPYFESALSGLPSVSVLAALGRIAHDAVLRGAGASLSAHPFGHLAEHRLPDGRLLIDSYHCSRLNQNTNRLTAAMFAAVFVRARAAAPAST